MAREPRSGGEGGRGRRDRNAPVADSPESDIVEKLAGVKLKRSYKLDAPKGVRGRNSDNTLIKKLMNWAPSIRLEDGMEKTYKWIYDEMTSGKASVVNALPRAVAAQ